MKPNILFLLPDQWRGDWWSGGARDVPVRTPTLAGLAKSGTTFASAVTPSPLCAPARACIATGQSYPAAGILDNSRDLPLDQPTVYRALRDAGYHVTGCGKFDLHKASYSWGRDGTHLLEEWGFSAGCDNEGKIDGVESYKQGKIGPYLSYLEANGSAADHVEDFRRRVRFGTFPTPLSEEDYCDNWITRNALGLLDETPAGKPWFLQVNFTGPHEPFDVTADMHRWYAETEFDLPFNPGNSNADHQAVRRNYAAMIENIDRNISRILNHPRVKNERENTLIIFSSDHGEMLGDHGFYGKCTPHNGSLHVPLILEGPGVAEGAAVSNPVSLLDLPRTILDAAGISDSIDCDSRSLLPAAGGGDLPREVVTSELRLGRSPEFQWRAAMDAQFKYVAWNDGRTALFDRSDYSETTDVSAELPEACERLAAELPASL